MTKDLDQAKAMYPNLEMKITKTHYSKAFYAGNVGMLIIGEWFPGFMANGRKDNLLTGYTWNDWALTRLPCDEKTYTTFGNPVWNSIHAKSKNQDAAFKFISWLGGPEGAKIVAKVGNYPAVVNEDIKKIFKDNLPDASSLKYYTEPKKVLPQLLTKYGSKVELSLNDLVDTYLTNTMSDDELKNTLKSKLEEIIKTSE
jgi:multiple sugar transport system substrate-binding protein